MKAAIYSPYLDTLGGGERYVVSFGMVLTSLGWGVDIQSSDKDIIVKLSERFGFNLDGFSVVDSIKRGDGYDLCFWLSDGSIPRLLARKNILHIQRPFYDIDGRSLINRMKLFRIQEIVVNSKFTKKWIDKEYPKQSIVIYPPIDVVSFHPGKKENIILSVGRFSQLEQSKRQDVLIRAFKKLYDGGNKDWRMVLVGGSEVGRTKYVDKLKKSARGYPITMSENVGFDEVKKLYSKSKMFWTASGYGIDEKKHPEKVEHFGMTVVEAMAAGCIVFAHNSGGHRESIQDGVNGFLWKDIRQLISKTIKVTSERKVSSISKKARQRSRDYSFEKFRKKVTKLAVA